MKPPSRRTIGWKPAGTSTGVIERARVAKAAVWRARRRATTASRRRQLAIRRRHRVGDGRVAALAQGRDGAGPVARHAVLAELELALEPRDRDLDADDGGDQGVDEV